MTPRVTPLRVDFAPGENPMQKIGFFILLAFLFFAYSRILDLTVPSLHLPQILSMMALASTLAFGGLQRAFSSSIGKLLLAFSVWMLICVPFSSWRGGSVEMLKDQWSKAFLCYLMVAGLTVTVKQARQVMMTLALAALVAAILAHILQFRNEGRLALPGGLLTNPNDFAQILLLGLPFWTLLVIPRGGILKHLVVLSAAAVLMATIFYSGSRAALLAAFIMASFLFLRVSVPAKFAMILGVAAIAIGLAVLAPRQIIDRYLTAFGEPETGERITEDEYSALQSRVSRKVLLWQSIKLTLTHPLFGVGPGVYMHASTVEFNSQGKRSLWKESHNAYTQVSSENGVPGFLFFTGALIACFRGLGNLRKSAASDPRSAEVSSLAFCLTMSLVGFAITSFFSSIAYKFFFPTVLGLSAGFIQSARNEIQARLEVAQPQIERSRVRLRPRHSPEPARAR